MKQGNRTTRSVSVRLMAAVFLVTGVLVISSCSRDPRLEALSDMTEPAPGIPSSERIEELKETIAQYEEVVEEKVFAAVRQAGYLKLLAVEYIRNELYGPALDALNEAILIEPRNKVLHDYAGIAAGYLAKAQASPVARERYLAMAEQSYLISLEIDSYYSDALFGLGTLYHFEMNRNLEALELLQTLTEREPNHISGLFVLGRTHAALGNIDEAVAAYDQIIDKTSDREAAEQARRNRQLLLGEER